MKLTLNIIGWIALSFIAVALADLIIGEFRAEVRTIEIKSPFEHPPVGAWEKK